MIVLDQASKKFDITVASESPLFRSSRKTGPPEAAFLRQPLDKLRWQSYRRAAFYTPSSSTLPVIQTQSAALPAAVAAAVPSSAGTIGFFKLLTAFVLGGLFFSTAIAAASACYAVGLQNVKVLWDVVKAILQAVWVSFTAALSTTKAALLLSEDGAKRASWKWRAAWQVLKQELSKTRKTAAEGVAALRQEAALYAGAVGAPGLIPLQYILDRFLPFSIAGALEESLRGSLTEIPQKTRSVQKIRLTGFSVGSRAPVLQAARTYELGDQAVAYDIDMDWKSDLEIKLTVYTAAGLARIPVTVKNVEFNGVIRAVFTPLVRDPPGFGAALVSFPKAPAVNMDVRVAGGDITRIPWLRSEFVSAIQKGITDELLWPKRVVVPSTASVWSGTGLKEKPLLSKESLEALETSDPLLKREQELAKQPMLRKQYEQPQKSSVRQRFKVFVNRSENNTTHTDESKAQLDSAAFTTQAQRTGHSPNMDMEQRRRMDEIQNGILLQGLFRLLHASSGQDGAS